MYGTRKDCFIGNTTIPHDEWKRNIINSRFTLVVRGDTPGSHAFVNGISAGCIPIIVSDLFEYGATPFNNVIPLHKYSVVIPEKAFMDNPTILMKTIEGLSEETIRSKLSVLVEVQKMMLLDHPESRVCDLILEAHTKIIK
jgi:hypothetical protein